jgi:hypothetical protein
MFRRAPRDSHGREPLLHGSNITLPDVRSEGLNEPCRRLWTAALRAGWLNLGHDESEVLKLVAQLPGQPFALRQADGSESGASSADSADDSGLDTPSPA